MPALDRSRSHSPLLYPYFPSTIVVVWSLTSQTLLLAWYAVSMLRCIRSHRPSHIALTIYNGPSQLPPQLLLHRPPQLWPTRHRNLTPLPPPHLDLRLDLPQRLLDLPSGITRHAQHRLARRLLARRLRHERMVPLVQALHEPGFGGRGEERHGDCDADDGVEVDARPDQEGGVQVEDYEGGRREAEGELRDEVGCEIVVAFLGRGVEAVGGEEEGADVAAEV
jgi:hypothetical protein